ncbi:MAG: hypothetical protein R3C15_21675 [Thermoleophilia bacterium]
MRRPSPAMLVACAALLVALGGGAYAAVELPRNAVTSRAIAPGAVRAGDLAAGSVGASRLRRAAATTGALARGAVTSTGLAVGAVGTAALADGAVTAAALAPGSVTGERVADGAIGDADLAAGIAAGKLTGSVPAAARADVATTAETLGGVALRRLDFRGAPGESATVLDTLGLRLVASCVPGTPAQPRLEATAGAAGSTIHVGAVEGAGVVRAPQNADLGPGNVVRLAPIQFSTAALVGTATYATPEGDVVEVDYRTVAQAFGGDGCAVQGFARVAPVG